MYTNLKDMKARHCRYIRTIIIHISVLHILRLMHLSLLWQRLSVISAELTRGSLKKIQPTVHNILTAEKKVFGHVPSCGNVRILCSLLPLRTYVRTSPLWTARGGETSKHLVSMMRKQPIIIRHRNIPSLLKLIPSSTITNVFFDAIRIWWNILLKSKR